MLYYAQSIPSDVPWKQKRCFVSIINNTISMHLIASQRVENSGYVIILLRVIENGLPILKYLLFAGEYACIHLYSVVLIFELESPYVLLFSTKWHIYDITGKISHTF